MKQVGESTGWHCGLFPESREGENSMSDNSKPRLQLIGEDGNAFSILGRAKKVLREAGRGDEFEEYRQEATSGDYDHLLRVTMKWFEVE